MNRLPAAVLARGHPALQHRIRLLNRGNHLPAVLCVNDERHRNLAFIFESELALQVSEAAVLQPHRNVLAETTISRRYVDRFAPGDELQPGKAQGAVPCPSAGALLSRSRHRLRRETVPHFLGSAQGENGASSEQNHPHNNSLQAERGFRSFSCLPLRKTLPTYRTLGQLLCPYILRRRFPVRKTFPTFPCVFCT